MILFFVETFFFQTTEFFMPCKEIESTISKFMMKIFESSCRKTKKIGLNLIVEIIFHVDNLTATARKFCE